MIRIAITGSNGQLGKSFQKIHSFFPEIEFLFLSKVQLDITDSMKVKEYFSNNKVDYIVNCAAYTKVDQAETEADLCNKVNIIGPRNLAKIANSMDATIIHISSDYVYDSTDLSKLTEESLTTPKSVYAQSKLDGENEVIENCERHFIIRTSWVYSEFENNFLKTMIKLSHQRDTLSIVNDQIGAPTYAVNLASMILKLIKEDIIQEKHHFGIYNWAAEGEISWYEFANYIFERIGSLIKTNPIPSTGFPTPASRPAWSVMSMQKIKAVFGFAPTYWKEEVDECLIALESD